MYIIKNIEILNTYKFVIDATLPSLNEYILNCRTSKKEGAKFKRTWDDIVSIFILQYLKNIKISNPVSISYKWYEKNKKRDKDNISSFGRKCIQDALVKTNVLQNDGWSCIVSFQDEFFIDEKHPRVEVTIYEYKN